MRLLPAALALYEVRYLITHLLAYAVARQGPGASRVSVWVLLCLTVGAGLLLRGGCRGLAAGAPRPGWSLRFVGSWILCSAVLAGLLTLGGLLHVALTIGPTHTPIAGAWSGVPAALSVGLFLTAALSGMRRLLFDFVRARRWFGNVHPSRSVLGLVSAISPPRAVPLRAGWSDRGPPPVRSPLAAF